MQRWTITKCFIGPTSSQGASQGALHSWLLRLNINFGLVFAPSRGRLPLAYLWWDGRGLHALDVVLKSPNGSQVVSRWSPCGSQVVPKWSTSDLSVSYLISSKRLLFRNISHNGSFQHCTRLYMGVPGCTCLGLPWSTLPQTAIDWLKCFCIYKTKRQKLEKNLSSAAFLEFLVWGPIMQKAQDDPLFWSSWITNQHNPSPVNKC